MNTFYLAGPMSGYPKFNFPAFHAAAEALREKGFEIISPAEMDAESDVAEKAMQSESGNLVDAGIKQTWGDLLGRDVKLIADGGLAGIIFLPGWHRSRGARLEAYVGVLCDLEFYAYTTDFGAEEITTHEVMQEICHAAR